MVAILGYGDLRWLKPVYSGDSLGAVTQVTGVTENSNGKTGVPRSVVPELLAVVPPSELNVPAGLGFSGANATYRTDDDKGGEIIDHVVGVTLEDAEHMLAVRLCQTQ